VPNEASAPKLDDELSYVRRKLRKIMLYATHGYYRTVGDKEKLNNKFFLEIIKEAYKALYTMNRVYQIMGAEDNVRSS